MSIKFSTEIIIDGYKVMIYEDGECIIYSPLCVAAAYLDYAEDNGHLLYDDITEYPISKETLTEIRAWYDSTIKGE